MKAWPSTCDTTFAELEHPPEQRAAMAQWASRRMLERDQKLHSVGIVFHAPSTDRSGRKLVWVVLLALVSLAAYFGVRT